MDADNLAVIEVAVGKVFGGKWIGGLVVNGWCGLVVNGSVWFGGKWRVEIIHCHGY